MKAKEIEPGGNGEGRGWILVFDTGDEVKASLLDFARQQRITDAHFTAIGALSHATIGYFEWDRKAYKHIPIEEQVEVLMLAGDIACKGDEPMVHAHTVLGTSEGMARGGHVIEAHVRPTLELILTEGKPALHREHDPETGLALIAL